MIESLRNRYIIPSKQFDHSSTYPQFIVEEPDAVPVFWNDVKTNVIYRITDVDGVRRYRVPGGGVYPSITTVLANQYNESLEEWKERVGLEKAKAIGSKATKRGSLIHGYIEDHLNGKEVDLRDESFDVRQMTKNLYNSISRINRVYQIESALWSDKLGIAGTADCIGEWDGVPAVIDFKTSKRLKDKSHILSYFIQCTGYVEMFAERYGKEIEDIVVLIAVEGDKPQVFHEKAINYKDALKETIASYYGTRN